ASSRARFRLGEESQDALADLLQALKNAVPGTFVDHEPSTGNPASELPAAREGHEAILSAVMHLNRHRQTVQPRPGRMTCAGEELHNQAALTGRLLEHRCDGGPRFVPWLTLRGEVLRRGHAEEVSDPLLWIARGPPRPQH